MDVINEDVINERKQTLLSDLEVVKTRLTEIEKRKLEDHALLNALTGAVQQCDDFLKRLHDASSDDGNDGDQSIPSVGFPLGNQAVEGL